MKFGTVADGTRDGALAVVDANNEWAVTVPDIAPTLQHALERWEAVSASLQHVSRQLEAGNLTGRARRVDGLEWLAAMPRAFQLLDGGGYGPHMELGYVRHGLKMPPEVSQTPLIYQCVADRILSPTEDFAFVGHDLGVDFEAELVVITGDVPQGAQRAEANAAIRLIGLMNDITLRSVQGSEFSSGFGFFHCKPKKTLAPFVVTPDELGAHWSGAVVKLPVRVEWNGRVFGEPNAGEDHLFDFATLVAEASRHRVLSAGTVIGGGTVSNQDRSRGHCCIFERRILEFIDKGQEATPFMSQGDRVRIEVKTPEGRSVFGAIDQCYRAGTAAHNGSRP
jgi:fumarylacetoacetate (FAA) hydrolase